MVELTEEQGDLVRYWLTPDVIAGMTAATLELVFCATETLCPELSEETAEAIQARAMELLAETTSLQDLGCLRYWVDVSEQVDVCLATETRFDHIASSSSWMGYVMDDEHFEETVYARVRELAESMPFPELAAEFDRLCALCDSGSFVVTIIGEVMRSRAQTVEEVMAALFTTSNTTITAPLVDKLEGLIVASIIGADAETPAS